MNAPKQKPSRTRAARSPSRRTDQTSTLQSPPPTQRAVELYCWLGDGKPEHHGSLTSIRAHFNPWRELVCITANSDGHRFAQLRLDHAQIRAVLHRLRESLLDLARLRGRNERDADFQALQQFNASRHPSDNQLPADVTARPMPWRDAVCLDAHSSVGGFFTLIHLYLTPIETEALAFDLERALRDMERFADV